MEEVQSLNALSTRMSIGAMSPAPDYDTVYRILTEREKDLELAAKIGRTLLQRNELLEAELAGLLDLRQQLEQQLAQLQHALSQKEALLKLYAQDATEQEGEEKGEQGEWIKVLTAECRDLRESNLELTAQADRLHRATAEVEEKERGLVQQCLEQFSEAKQRLSELRDEAETRATEHERLQDEYEELSRVYEGELEAQQQLREENESLREQLTEAHDSATQFSHNVSDLQKMYDECSILLKAAQDEIHALQEKSVQNSSPPTQDGEHATAPADHESIVQEIEEALRKEIIAASTLPERPSSPKQYALQRTQAVMRTVRAATQAMARRQDRLSAEAKTVPSADNLSLKPPLASSPMYPFHPLAASSPEGPARSSVSVGTGQSPLVPQPPSPIVSEAGSTLSLPEELAWYRHQHYVAPEKLQIVKPLEGSVTLLKWKLLASPQLGGATTFFSDAARPGVHVKGWRAAGIRDGRQQTRDAPDLLVPDARIKSLSTSDLSRIPSKEHTFTTPSSASRSFVTSASPGYRKGLQREKLSYNRVSNLQQSTKASGSGMNTVSELELGGRASRLSDSGRVARDGSKEESLQEAASAQSSFLNQVGSFFGLSRFGLGRGGGQDEEKEEEREKGEDEVDIHTSTPDAGLAGIL